MTNELLWTLSPQAVFCSFSAQVAATTGWSDRDWLGKPLQSFLHPFDLPTVRDRYRDVLAGRTVRFANIRCLSRDGNYVGWALSFVPQIEDDVVSEVLVLGHTSEAPTGKEPLLPPMQALGQFSGIEKRTSSTVMEYVGLAKLLEGMLGNSPIGFALLDENLRFICLNQAFSEMTGFSPAQQLGQSLRDLLPKVAALVDPVMQNVLTTGESVTDYEAELQRTAAAVDSHRHAQMSFYPIPDLHGGICGVATIALDVTERKRAEAGLKKTSDELARSNRALEEFSHIASHDLREPLRTISTFVNLLKKKYEGTLDRCGDEYISFVVDGTVRMQNLIEKILEFSKAGSSDRGAGLVDCHSVVTAVLRNLKTALDESGGSVSFDPLPTIPGDEALLTQVFQNLIANATKFRSTTELKIHISARRELNTWIFSVADNGIGISSDQFLNIFTPFRRLHSHEAYAGVGLGLAICKKSIERQGGRIWVASESGKGSIFSFTTPAIPTGGHLENGSLETIG